MAKTTNYDESHIQRHAGLQGIRKKATVYIGPTDSNGLWTILREPADNAVDLALKGLNKLCHIVFDPDGSYWVLDEGPGFPVGEKVFEDERGRKEKLSTFYVATGLTHAGSNFDSEQASRGTHGIGVKATNAMSRLCDFYTHRDSKWYAIFYRDGKVKKDVHKVAKAPKLPHKIKMKRGSAVHFVPDTTLFAKKSKISIDDVKQWCELTAFLVPNITIKLTTAKGKTKTWKTKGIGDYINSRLETLGAEAMGKTFILHDRYCDVALSFANAEENEVKAYTNGLLNVDGGEHVKAVYAAMAKALKPPKGKKKKTPEYTPKDLQDGMIGIINAKIAAPKFSNQRKDGLIDDRIYDPVYNAALGAFTEFFKKHKSLAKAIIARATLLRKKTADFLKDKKLIKNVKGANRGLSAKFSDVNNNKTPIEERELYLVEGDSAGGTAKTARDKRFQATFALRGKPLNVMTAAKDKINANKEITGILAGIGLGTDKKDKDAVRFGKIILLADPDVDGRHINCLLLTFFWKYLPHLFKKGMIYMLIAPEYFTEYKGKIHFGQSVEEVQKSTGTDKKLNIQHIKGWGELNSEQLAPLAFDVETRKLIRVLPPEDKKGVKAFEDLMGKSPLYRQQLLGVVADGAAGGEDD